MANQYKDKAGHWTTKENDGGECQHNGNSSTNTSEKGLSNEEAVKKVNEGKEPAFDDDYESDFEEDDVPWWERDDDPITEYPEKESDETIPEKPQVANKPYDILKRLMNGERINNINISDDIPDARSSYILPNGKFISGDKDSSHENLNGMLEADGFKDIGLMAFNPAVYGSRVSKIESIKGTQIRPEEKKAIEKIVDYYKSHPDKNHIMDVNGTPYNVNDFEPDELVKQIVYNINHKR